LRIPHGGNICTLGLETIPTAWRGNEYCQISHIGRKQETTYHMMVQQSLVSLPKTIRERGGSDICNTLVGGGLERIEYKI
jgi:hypothetical protein